MSIIKVTNLTKVYRNYKKEKGMLGSVKNLFHREFFEKTAVNSISFEVDEGEIIGFLGPNGSGKTTTLKMLSGILYPTAGSAEILKYIPWERNNHFRKQFAIVMGQKNQLWWDLPAGESFELNRLIYQIDHKNYLQTLDGLVDLMGVRELLKVPVRTLSLGERMKMELIGSLLHQPKVLFLDEPTIGLDIVSQRKIQEFVKELNRLNNTTIILTSHYMNDIEKLCKRLILINHGAIIYDGSLGDIKKKFSRHKIFKVSFLDAVKAEEMKKLGELTIISPYEIELKVNNEQAPEVSRFLYENYDISDLSINETPVEDVIAQAFTM